MAKTLRQEHTEHTRRALLAAATRLFADKGYADTSIDDVVIGARVTRGALYHHFPSKLEIFRAVCTTAEEDVVARVRDSARTGGGTPRERVMRALDTYFEESRDPTYQAIVLREAHETQLRPETTRYIPALSELVRSLIRELQRADAITAEDPELLARLVCAVLCEAAYAIGTDKEPERVAAQAKALVDRMLFGGNGSEDRRPQLGQAGRPGPAFT
jgi:AcrR family transcriptional regulator